VGKPTPFSSYNQDNMPSATGKIFNRNVIIAGALYMQNGSTLTKVIDKDGTVTVAGITMTNITATGNTALGNAVTDTTTIIGATSIQSTSASGLVVGANGATNPVLKVSCATASVATGLSLTGAAAAGGMAIAVISSGTNENLTIDAKGSGTITLGGTSTGNIVLSRAMTGVSSSMTSGYTSRSATAVPATAGAVAAGLPFTAYSNGMGIEWTSNAPTHTRPKGSLCLNIGGSSGSTRAYINTDGALSLIHI
jgi:hypothetical protein